MFDVPTGSNDESATNGKEVLTSSPEESETDKDENNPYHDGKVKI